MGAINLRAKVVLIPDGSPWITDETLTAPIAKVTCDEIILHA